MSSNLIYFLTQTKITDALCGFRVISGNYLMIICSDEK